MFSFKKKSQGTPLELAITGMHCTSCAMTIDGTLEDIDGVFESTTNYGKQKTLVMYDPQRLSPEKIKKEIEKLNYKVSVTTSI